MRPEDVLVEQVPECIDQVSALCQRRHEGLDDAAT